MKAKDLINWGALSRILSGSRQTVRKNSVPKVHQQIVDELLQAVDAVLLKAGSARQKENKTGNTDDADL
jgi:hypothetical protein